SLIAKSKSGSMQRDHDYTNARDHHDLASTTSVSNSAKSKVLKKLDARKIKTGSYPVMFTPEMARTLIGTFFSAISGMSQYKKTSFLLNAHDELIFPNFMHIEEQPLIKKGLASQCYDADGIPLKNSLIIQNGILQRYLLSSYSAKALSLEPTGNAGGISNTIVSNTGHSNKDLLKLMNKGIIVNDMMGQGVNTLTGDYSRGATGFWVENGEIQYPIDEFTVAGNLKEMFKNIVAIGNDSDIRSSISTGSILIESLHISGS
ncbi:MAG: PmbA protein, partial [Francisellaceae bacterium]